MCSSVADRYVGLSLAAQHVLAAMILLDQTADPDALAPALGWARADVSAVVDELAERGWLDAERAGGGSGRLLAAHARIWLRYDEPLIRGLSTTMFSRPSPRG